MSAVPAFDPPADNPLTAPFWSAAARNAIALPKCSVCGRWQWYPEMSGTDCPDGELQWEDVSTTGTVYTFTRVHRSFLPTGGITTPYLVGSIELDGVAGPKLVATLADVPGIGIGARVRARFERVGAHVHPIFEPTTVLDPLAAGRSGTQPSPNP